MTVLLAPWCMMPLELLQDEGYGRAHLVVYGLIDYRAGRRGWFFESQKRIADEAGLSLRSVKRAISDLRKGGFLETEQLGADHGGICRYLVPARTRAAPPVDDTTLRQELHGVVPDLARGGATDGLPNIDPSIDPTGETSRRLPSPGTSAEKRESKAKPGPRLDVVVDAFRARGMAVPVLGGGNGKLAQELLRAGYMAEEIAECWDDIERDRFEPGGARYLNFGYLVRNEVLRRWRRWKVARTEGESESDDRNARTKPAAGVGAAVVDRGARGAASRFAWLDEPGHGGPPSAGRPPGGS